MKEMDEILSLALDALDLDSPASQRRAAGSRMHSVQREYESANTPDAEERKAQGEPGGVVMGAAGAAGGEIAHLVGASEGNPGCCAGVQAQGSGLGAAGGLAGTLSTAVPYQAVSASPSLLASHAHAQDASSLTGGAKAGQAWHQDSNVVWDQVPTFTLACCVGMQLP